MLAIPSRKQIAKIDQLTIESGTTEDELIFRAVATYLFWVTQYLPSHASVAVLCGVGNNGADGLLLAEQLNNRGFRVTVLISEFGNARSKSNFKYLSRVNANRDIRRVLVKSQSDIDLLNSGDFLIDALFGNGLDRPLKGLFLSLVRKVNESYKHIFALDIPSGLLPFGQQTSVAIKCERTLSFEFPKQEFFAAENEKYVGKWEFNSIGLSEKAVQDQELNTFLIEENDVRSLLHPRTEFAHKGVMGKVLHLVNLGHMYGAGAITIRACCTAGCGLSYIHSISKFNQSLPSETIYLDAIDLEEINKYDTISVGPGLGTSDNATEVLDRVLTHLKKPAIFDADALNIIAREKWIGRIPNHSVITPHIKEFGRLFGDLNTHDERISMQRKASQEHHLFIVLKGRYTSISDVNGMIYYNRTGNPALARGGSGDVLTGIITSLMSQGLSPFDAAIASVYIHGLAADLYIENHHESAMSIDDLIHHLPKARMSIVHSP